jgi:hypothetical protein
METMEEAQNQEEKSGEDGNPRILCAHGGKQPQRSLVQRKPYNGQAGNDKRKTDKQRLL